MKVHPAVKFVSLVAALAILGAGCYSSNTTNTTTTGTGTSVSIVSGSFNPSLLTVAKGTTVTWTNNDSVSHTVTGNTTGGPKSSTLAPGQTYSFTFNTAGSYSYICTIHPDMTGTVTVTP